MKNKSDCPTLLRGHLKGIALSAWGHANLHGRFAFTTPTTPIDIAAIVQLLAQQPIAPDDAEP